MVKLYAALKLPVNPDDAPFILSRAQLWQALLRKVRHADEFVPVMRDCTVVTDEGDFVVRNAVLEKHDGTLRHMTER